MTARDKTEPSIEIEKMILKVNGRPLEFADGPEKLAISLSLGKGAILGTISSELIRARTRDPEATLSPPPLFVVRFATDINRRNRVLSKSGLRNPTFVHREMDELAWPYRPFWQTVEQAGFRPVVRSALKGLKEKDGVWLMLHALDEDVK